MKMTLKLSFFLAVFHCATFSLSAEEAINGNLLSNCEFQSANGMLPENWHGLSGERAKAYSTKDGILQISNLTGAYANFVSQSVFIDEAKTYYFEAELRSDALSGSAGVVYSIYDGNNRKIVSDHPILRSFHGPQEEWTKFSSIIPIPVGQGAKRLSVGFILYNPARRKGLKDSIQFRRPLLCEYAGQKVLAPIVSKAKAALHLPDSPFPSNFTGEPIGSIYSLERPGVGFLRLNTGIMPKADVDMKVSVPDGVDLELYLSRVGNVRLSKIEPVEKGHYKLSRNIAWVTWGNALLFRACENAPKSFDIVIDVSACGKTVTYKIPVRVFDTKCESRLPLTRRFNSWQAFPVARMDIQNPSNKLACLLADYWKGAGWRHTAFVEIDGAFPARIKAATRYLAEGDERLANLAVDAKGAPINSWCDTDWISRDTAHFVKRLNKIGVGKLLVNTEYAMWDFEPYNEGPVTSGCFCERCRNEFAKFKSFINTPSAFEILAKYKSEWIKFRYHQRAEVVRSAVKAVKTVNPNLRFILCSMPGDPGNDPDWMLKYGIDLNLYSDFVDIYATMNYSQGLDYFRSLEEECRILTKETRMFISNGWGRQNEPRRAGMQLLAAFFAGVDYPFVGQGLYVAQCNQIAAFRNAMNFIANTESRWSNAKVLVDGKTKVTPGFRSENNIYSLERRASDGVRHLMIFNNSENENAFATVSISDNENLKVVVTPLSWKYLELSKANIEKLKRESVAASQEENAAIQGYEKLFKEQSLNGISTSSTPDVFTVKTPIQSVEFDLKNNGIASWKLPLRKVAQMLGRDYFTTDGMFSEPKKGEGIVESSNILKDRAVVTIAYRVANSPYDGLLVRRRYTIMRNTPSIDIAVEVVPDGGYRPFRMRTGANILFSKEMPSPTDVASIYICDGKEYAGTKHIVFARKDAKFPSDKPFFVGRYTKEANEISSSKCSVKSVSDGSIFECTVSSVDEIFGWRARKSASLELIFPDAYDHYDPHAVKTWKANYSFTIKGSPAEE